MAKTLVVFDWDNTLKPSSKGIADLGRLKKKIQKCIRFLESKDNVDVVIITNSPSQKVYNVLPSISVPVYSARDQFSETHPYCDWKSKMFNTVVREKSPDQIIGIGDSDGDAHSCRQVGKKFGLPTKCIQFIPYPTQKQIEVQLRYVRYALESIIDIDNKHDVKLS